VGNFRAFVLLEPPTLKHCHPFPPNTAQRMGWPRPCSSRVLFGQGDTPVIPAQRTREKKSITHIPRKINSLNFDSNAMKMQLVSPRVNFKNLHYAF